MNCRQTIMIIEADLDELKANLKVFEHWLAAQPLAAKSSLESIAINRVIKQYCTIMHKDERCL